MKESTWNECIENNKSYLISPDIAKSNSLVNIAFDRMSFLKTITINSQNASYVFEMYYSSLLEIMHAIVLIKGYNVNNHVCLGFYLRDVLKRDDMFRIFDDVRYKRNSIVYYGKLLNYEIAKSTLNKLNSMVNDLKKYIKLKKETSAGIVVFHKDKYLLLHYNAGHWDLPKGHVEKNESLKQTALRETKEETNLDIELINGFEEKIQYDFTNTQLIHKTVYFYLGEAKSDKVKISHEHIGYEWLTYSDVINKLTFDTAKDVLEKAHDFLLKQ